MNRPLSKGTLFVTTRPAWTVTLDTFATHPVLQSRALANTNHRAMKLRCRLDGCDGLSVSL
jgi:hypothetical protein